jgi:formate dehydrogenase subunit gamma
VIGVLLLLLTGLVMWRAWWTPPILLIRVASVLHAIAAVWSIGLIIVHIYAAIWVRGSIHAMARGTVPRAWARQHHRLWYRKTTGDNH